MRAISGDTLRQQLYRWACVLWRHGLCNVEIMAVLDLLASFHSSWSPEERGRIVRAIEEDATSGTGHREDPSGWIGPPPAPGEERWAALDEEEWSQKYTERRSLGCP